MSLLTLPPAIETAALTKQFSSQRPWLRALTRLSGRAADPRAAPPRLAVDHVSLRVEQRELFGLLGPNGAGKTTLIKLLSTLIVPSSGEARVGGFDLRQEAAIKRLIGLVTADERSFYWRLTGRQNLEFFAALHHLPPAIIPQRVHETLAQVDLLDMAEARFNAYSTGMRQRLAIARALLHQPRILFMDEPTKGLDPLAARQLHRLIREQLITQQGMTVFLSTHLLDEAEQLCDRVAVMHKGQLRGVGSVTELRQALALPERYTLIVQGLPWDDNPSQALKLPCAYTAAAVSAPRTAAPDTAAQEIELTFDAAPTPGMGVLDQVITALHAQGASLRSIQHTPAPLETIFEHLLENPSAAPSAAPRLPSLSPALQPQPHPIGRTALSATLRVAQAFLLRDLREEASYRLSFLLQFVGVGFSMAVFYYLGRLMDAAVSPYLAGYRGDYFAFVLIGLAFSGYFGVGLSSFADSLRRAQTTGTLEAMLTSPTRLAVIILSSSLWSYLMTTLRVGVYLSLGALLAGVDLGRGNIPAALLILALTVVAFSSLGVLAACFIMVFKRGDPVTWSLTALSNLVGGVYYPIAVLPGWLQLLARLLPITYALEAMRRALLNGASLAELLPDILALTLFSLALLPLSLLLFRLAVRQARVDGSLTHY